MTKKIKIGGAQANGTTITVRVQIGSEIPVGFSNVVFEQISANQAKVDFDYFGPACTIYSRPKSGYASDGKDVLGGFPQSISHYPEGNLPVHHTMYSWTTLVEGVVYVDMLYSDDGVTLIPAGNDVVLSNTITMSGAVAAAPTAIYPSTIEVVQGTVSGTVIATLSSNVAGAVFSEGTPDQTLVSVGDDGKVTLLSDASSTGDYVIKAIATTPGGAYNQNVTATVVAEVTGGTASVNGPTELAAALSSAVSGDTLTLASGNYGALSLTKTFTNYVTIEAANPAAPPVFTSFVLTNCAYIKVDGVHVSGTSDGGSGGRFMHVNGGNHIQILNCEINGSVNGSYEGAHAFQIQNNPSFVTFSGNYVHDALNGIVVFGCTNFVCSENVVDYIGADFFKLAGVNTGLFENNTGGGHLFPNATAHADFMQFQSTSSDIIIRGNVYLAQNNERAQGIFLKDGTYTNVLIENNIIISGKANALFVNPPASGVTIRYNTALNTVGLGHNNASASAPSGSTVENNIVSNTVGSLSGTNVVAQYLAGAGQPYYYASLYADVVKDLGVTIADLAPVPGSLAETKGAYARIAELLA